MARSLSDWTERPDASKEDIGLGGSDPLAIIFSHKEAPPVYCALSYQTI